MEVRITLQAVILLLCLNAVSLVQEIMADGKECQSAVKCRKFVRITRAAALRFPLSLTDGQPIAAGCSLNSRYVMYRIIGQGISSNVWDCFDKVKREAVVVKIINNTEPYNKIGYMEVLFNKFIGNIDGSEIHFPRMLDHFVHCNLLCIVFERLGRRMCDVQRKNYYFPLPLSLVQDVGRQLLESVEFLHRSRFIHTDLKPDNILFVSSKHRLTPVSKTAKGVREDAPDYNYVLPASNAIKVIDFGNACVEKDASNYTVGARPYRAPEVILGLGWSFPCDIWSIGCILVELCMGRVIFNVTEDLEHLARMEALLERFPSQMLKRAKHTDAKKYVKKGVLNWPEGATSPESVQRVQRASLLQSDSMLRARCDSEDFIQLVLGLLKLDPSERLTASEALNHPFFTRDLLN